MPPEKDSARYDQATPIPTYDEAVAGTSRSAFEADWPDEGHGLLSSRRRTSLAASRRPDGYRPPTVETDDEDSLYGLSDGESDDDETTQVRREMHEMDVVDAEHEPPRNLSSLWGKRIGFSLPRWRWSWRWRLPRLRIRLGGNASSGEEESEARWTWPSLPSLGGGSASLIIVARMVAIVLVLGFLYLLFLSDLFTGMARRMGTQMFDPESVRVHVQSMVDPARIRDKLQTFTSYAHVAGTAGDLVLARGLESDFAQFGLEDVRADEYYVYLNYPRPDGRAVELLGPDGKPQWAATLEEPDLGFETAGNQTLAFHGHSKSGSASGPLVYANYGSRADFRALHDAGIDTKGAVALVRSRGAGALGDLGAKVRAAELAGFAGCLVYSDPEGDGESEDSRLPDDAVQRGSVSLTGWVLGDPLTPGWESTKELPRLEPDKSPALVGIPSLPLAWRDAKALVQRLQGHGTLVSDIAGDGASWAGGIPNLEWWTGNLSSPVVRLRNEQDEEREQAVVNVYGRIVGIEQGHKSVVVGNARDSLAFGAAAPHSGTAVMLEVVRILGDLVARGWRPLRTVEFMSWDGAAYNLIGSTEYVERNLERLRDDALAYVNLDAAVSGPDFAASGSPVFAKLLRQVLNRVSDPAANATLRELLDGKKQPFLEGLGAASDYAAFQAVAGTSSLDLRFEQSPDSSHFAPPHGSSYDSFDWVDRVGDPGFVYHTLLGQVLGLLVVELADRPVLPFDLAAYAGSLGRWVGDLDEKDVNLAPLRAAAGAVASAVDEFDKWELSWESSVVAANGWEPSGLGKKRCEYNDRMGRFETDLLDTATGGGLPNRTQFRHVVFGPDPWSPRHVSFFPAVRDALEAGDTHRADAAVAKTAGIIKAAAKKLVE